MIEGPRSVAHPLVSLPTVPVVPVKDPSMGRSPACCRSLLPRARLVQLHGRQVSVTCLASSTPTGSASSGARASALRGLPSRGHPADAGPNRRAVSSRGTPTWTTPAPAESERPHRSVGCSGSTTVSVVLRAALLTGVRQRASCWVCTTKSPRCWRKLSRCLPPCAQAPITWGREVLSSWRSWVVGRALRRGRGPRLGRGR